MDIDFTWGRPWCHCRGPKLFLAGLRDGSWQCGHVVEPRSGSRKSISCQNEIGRVVSPREPRINKSVFCMYRLPWVDAISWTKFTSHALQHDVAKFGTWRPFDMLSSAPMVIKLSSSKLLADFFTQGSVEKSKPSHITTSTWQPMAALQGQVARFVQSGAVVALQHRESRARSRLRGRISRRAGARHTALPCCSPLGGEAASS